MAPRPRLWDICQAELTWLLHHSALHSSHRYYNITILFCFAVSLSAVRPSQWLTNNWTKFWQFICSYLFLCQCCCQLFYFWSASVNSSFMARQPSSQGLLYFACMAELSWADWPKCFCPANPTSDSPWFHLPSLLSPRPINKLKGHPFGCFALDLGWKFASLQYILWVKFEFFYAL